MKAVIIRTYSIDECNDVVMAVNRDEKTFYSDRSFIAKPDFVMDHLLNTMHNSLNFKRKYNSHEIIEV